MELNSSLKNYSNEKKLFMLQQLISIIENSESIKERVASLQKLATLGVTNEDYYDLLENLLISDSSHKIRCLAANSLKSLFLTKSFIPMKWSFKHEPSVKCLIAITNTLGAIDNAKSKRFLINELRNISIKKYSKHIKSLFENGQLEGYAGPQLAGPQLARQLNNFHIIKFLENNFRRFNYSLNLGEVVSLDLSNVSSHVFDYKVLKLPDFIGTLESLEKLDLKFNRIKSVPNTIKNLSSLKYLNLSYNKIRKIPADMCNLRSLEYLNLKSNKITSLPDGIGKISHLKSLNLRSNNLKNVPKTIDNLKDLKMLVLHGNQLDDFSLSFHESTLKKLELGLNNFQNIPSTLRNLEYLEELGLEGNNITKIPKWLCDLTSLKVLRLHNNNINNLPNSFGNLIQLKELTLWNNHIKTLPKTFRSLSNLKNLNLNWNDLRAFPESLPESLEILSLWGNKIQKIPKSIEKLKNLRILDLNFNKNLDLSRKNLNLEKNGLIIYK